MNGEYITDIVNLFLDRFDTLIEQLGRVADALEASGE